MRVSRSGPMSVPKGTMPNMCRHLDAGPSSPDSSANLPPAALAATATAAAACLALAALCSRSGVTARCLTLQLETTATAVAYLQLLLARSRDS